MKKLLFFSILGIILFVSYSGAQKNVFEDGAVGQGAITSFSLVMTDSLGKQLKLNIINVEGNFVWGKNTTMRFIIDENTMISDSQRQYIFEDLYEGLTVRIWESETNPFRLEFGTSIASKVIVVSD